jgi:hypothetical protein
MNFLQRNGRFIVPVPWLLLAAFKLWQGSKSSDISQYLQALGFAGIALVFYIGQSQIHAARRKNTAEST